MSIKASLNSRDLKKLSFNLSNPLIKKADSSFFNKILSGILSDKKNYVLAYLSFILILSLNVVYMPKTIATLRHSFKNIIVTL